MPVENQHTAGIGSFGSEPITIGSISIGAHSGATADMPSGIVNFPYRQMTATEYVMKDIERQKQALLESLCVKFEKAMLWNTFPSQAPEPEKKPVPKRTVPEFFVINWKPFHEFRVDPDDKLFWRLFPQENWAEAPKALDNEIQCSLVWWVDEAVLNGRDPDEWAMELFIRDRRLAAKRTNYGPMSYRDDMLKPKEREHVKRMARRRMDEMDKLETMRSMGQLELCAGKGILSETGAMVYGAMLGRDISKEPPKCPKQSQPRSS